MNLWYKLLSIVEDVKLMMLIRLSGALVLMENFLLNPYMLSLAMLIWYLCLCMLSGNCLCMLSVRSIWSYELLSGN